MKWFPEPGEIIPIPQTKLLHDCPQIISYSEWIDGLGKYRWTHKDGTPRTYNELDYEWKRIFDKVTKYTDGMFHFKTIEDPFYFTSMFLFKVPTAWLKFKTSLEFFLGTLDGKNINPEEFHAGYQRTLEHNGGEEENRTFDRSIEENSKLSGNDSSNNTSTTTRDGYTDQQKGRTIQYNQGVQAYEKTLNNDNIGSLGGDYASTFSDNIGLSIIADRKDKTSTENIDTISHSTNSKGKMGDVEQNKKKQNYKETVKETRINYYDQLAFLRERIEHLNVMETFANEFNALFQNVSYFSIDF